MLGAEEGCSVLQLTRQAPAPVFMVADPKQWAYLHPTPKHLFITPKPEVHTGSWLAIGGAAQTKTHRGSNAGVAELYKWFDTVIGK